MRLTFVYAFLFAYAPPTSPQQAWQPALQLPEIVLPVHWQ